MEVEYEWNTWRFVRGVKKETKKKNKGTYRTATIGDTVEELNNREYLISCIKNRIKSTQNVDVKIIGWKWRYECGMSNDVH